MSIRKLTMSEFIDHISRCTHHQLHIEAMVLVAEYFNAEMLHERIEGYTSELAYYGYLPDDIQQRFDADKALLLEHIKQTNGEHPSKVFRNLLNG